MNVVRSHAHPPNTPRGCANAPRGGVCVRVKDEKLEAPDLNNVVLTLVSVPSTTPAAVRLRGLLKTALRRFHFRCTGVATAGIADAAGAAGPTVRPSEPSTRQNAAERKGATT
jgi:hypothetical protein